MFLPPHVIVFINACTGAKVQQTSYLCKMDYIYWALTFRVSGTRAIKFDQTRLMDILKQLKYDFGPFTMDLGKLDVIKLVVYFFGHCDTNYYLGVLTFGCHHETPQRSVVFVGGGSNPLIVVLFQGKRCINVEFYVNSHCS